MNNRILPITILVFLGLISANLVVLDILLLRGKSRIEKETSWEAFPAPTPPSTALPAADSCGTICQQTIAQKIAEALATISATSVVKETTVKERVVSATPQPQVIYIPLGGGGTTTNTTWTDVGNTGVYIDLADYPSAKRIYFEGFIKVKHGNGKAYGRLYDVTHGIGVQGGEIETSSENFTYVESGNLSLWQGKNLYRVQIKSLNGYEAAFDTGRVKIII